MEIRIYYPQGGIKFICTSVEDFEDHADCLDKYDWEILSQEMNYLPDEIIEKFHEQLNWIHFSFSFEKKPTEEFLIKYSNKIRFDLIINNIFSWHALFHNLCHTQTALDLIATAQNDNNYEVFKKAEQMFRENIGELFIQGTRFE